jgi:hypothetical protein
MWYKKFFRLFPLFFVLSLGHLALLGIVGFAVVRYVTESFVGLSWLYYVFGVLILLVGVQLLRVAFVKAVDKAAKSL